MEVKAIHQIIRLNAEGQQEIVKPGQVFTSTGDELRDLKAAKAISTDKGDIKEAKARQGDDEIEDLLDGEDDENETITPAADVLTTTTAPKPASKATAAKTGTKAKAAAPAKSAAVVAAETKAAETKAAEDAAANQAAADAAGTENGNSSEADAEDNDLL